LLGETLALHERVHNRRGVAQCFEGLAEVAFARGAAATAARLVGAAAAHRVAVAARPTAREQDRLHPLEVAIRRTLGDSADHEFQVGRTLSALAAIGLADDVVRSGPPAEPDQKVAELTPRQREVAALVASGRTNRQIARELGISEKTTEIHVRNLMARLGTSSRAGVAAWAVAHGIRKAP